VHRTKCGAGDGQDIWCSFPKCSEEEEKLLREIFIYLFIRTSEKDFAKFSSLLISCRKGGAQSGKLDNAAFHRHGDTH
jgi:hypothetical protein